MLKQFFLLFITIFLLVIQQVDAQVPDVDKLSDAQIEQFLKEGEARGMSESQIEAAAMANGYSVMDIAKVRERINRVKTKTNSTVSVDTKVEREQIGEIAERTEVQVTNEEQVSTKKNVYGSSIFNNKNLSFEPNLRIPTPLNYILGAGDQLKVDITGYAYQHYDLEVSPEGTVKLESLSPINVNGLTVKDAKEKITDRLKVLFAGLRNGSLNLDMTLGNVKSIKVFVLGEVVKPGSYTVSSLATAFNALYLSGGPSPIGTLRNIKVLRNNKEIGIIDVYELLTTGSFGKDISLRDQDVILIPTAEKRVEITGEVRRPMIFELKQGETFADALSYAGGFTEQAYKASLTVTRNTDKERKLLNFSADIASSFLALNGDNYFVPTILNRFENRVEVLGAVFRPGEFALGQNLKTVKQLVQRADGLREDAFLNRAILVREQENLDPLFISLDIGAIIRGDIKDVELKRQDQLVIKSIVEVRQLRTVSIEGAVNSPGSFDYADGMTVKDIILLSGGFTEGAANKRLEIARRIKSDDPTQKSVEIIDMNIDKALPLNSVSLDLKPFDKIFVRSLANYDSQEIVEIEGEVNYPGAYAIGNRSERITDLIERAGGMKPESYLNGAKFFRNGKQVAVSLPDAFSSKSSVNDLLLQEGDKLIIPKAAETVSFQGQFLNPVDVAYQLDYSFQDYIAQAGGFTDSAFVKKAYVIYANGLTDRTRSFLGLKIYPKVERGMTIIVPTKNRDKWTGSERISISTGLVSVSAVLLTLFRLI
jgi:protein involved in polysaccharide export with SLBB domain